MRLSDFIMLNEEEKKSAVLHEGVLIAKRAIPNYMVFLFQIDSYYVEAFCNQSNKSVEAYRAFRNTLPLQPYLEEIPINDLLN